MAGHFKTVLDGADDHAKLQDLCKLTYKEQGVWFLNAVWEVQVQGKKGSEYAERIWDYVEKAGTIDNAKQSGCALDELEAHRFLEAFDEAHTVLQMRSALRKTGALGQNERPKEVPLTHFLLDKYEADWHNLVNADQGDNSAKIAEAQDKLSAVQEAFDASAAADAAAAAALKDALAKEQAAKEAEAPFKAAEAPFKAAQEEVESALAEVKAQEDAYNSKTEELKKASEEGGVVSRNRAKVSLDAHLAEDPLPLRKAKITLEAANKRAEKARQPFLEARAPFLAATEAAEAARTEAEEAKARAAAAVQAAQEAVAEAEAFLADLMKNPGSGHGALWWIERELYEKKKYMPVSKGGVR